MSADDGADSSLTELGIGTASADPDAEGEEGALDEAAGRAVPAP